MYTMMMNYLMHDYKILYLWNINRTVSELCLHCDCNSNSVSDSSISDYEDAIKSLPLSDCINTILVAEFEYQVDSYFDKCIEPTIDHIKLNEF